MLRVVLDTNISVSGLLSPRGAPAQILAAYRTGRFTLITSEPMLAELEEVLSRRKFAPRFTAAQAAELLELFRKNAEMVSVTGQVKLCRDPDDDIILETALNGGADLLVSGDADLMDPVLTAELRSKGIQVVSPAVLLRVLELVSADPSSEPNAPL